MKMKEMVLLRLPVERCIDACDCDVEEAMETGRGMLIVRELSRRLYLNDKGNKITAIN